MPQKKKKKLGGIINCDLYFSPTGIKNVLISSKIEKKKKPQEIIEFRAFPWGCCREKKERKQNPWQNNWGLSFPILAGLWNYNKYGNKTQMIVQFREPFFIALCYYQILLGKNWHFCRTIRCSTFNHDLRERTKKGEVIPIIRLRMYQDGDSL